jgi:hypothetical protein
VLGREATIPAEPLGNSQITDRPLNERSPTVGAPRLTRRSDGEPRRGVLLYIPADGRQIRSPVGERMNRWFVVAESSRRQDNNREVILVPTSTIHAKEMGTLTTACGIRCESWPKWWDQSFPLGPGQDCCSRCSDIALHR